MTATATGLMVYSLVMKPNQTDDNWLSLVWLTLNNWLQLVQNQSRLTLMHSDWHRLLYGLQVRVLRVRAAS